MTTPFTIEARAAPPASRNPPPLGPSAGPGMGAERARPAPSDWLRASGSRAAIGPWGCLARGRARCGGGAWKLLEVRGRSGGANGRGAGASAGGGAAREEGRAGHRPRPLPGSAPRRSDRGRPRGRRAGCIPILGVAGHSARASGAGGRRAAGGAPGRPWPPPAPRAPPCWSPLATPCSYPSTRYPRRPAGIAPSPPLPRPCAIRAGARTRARAGAAASPEGRRRSSGHCPPAALSQLALPGVPTQPPSRPVPVSPGWRRAPTCARACPALLQPQQRPDPGRLASGGGRTGLAKPLPVPVRTGVDSIDTLCFGVARVSVSCARGSECPRGSRLHAPKWRELGTARGVEEPRRGVSDLHPGIVSVEVWFSYREEGRG